MTYDLKTILILSSHLFLSLPNYHFIIGFPRIILQTFLFSLVLFICSSHISPQSPRFNYPNNNRKSRDISVGIALLYGLDDRGPRVRFLAGAGNFSLHYSVQNGSGAHPASYPMDTRGYFPGGKAAEARS
jgi:hypothetical protein